MTSGDADQAAERLRAALRDVDAGKKTKLYPADVRILLEEREKWTAATEYGQPETEWAWTTRRPVRPGVYDGVIIHEADNEADARRHLVKATNRHVVARQCSAWRLTAEDGENGIAR